MIKKLILVVEDEEHLLELIKMRLEHLGYEVITAENGRDGISKAIAEKPDLILVDMMMPEVNGIDMIKMVRQNHDLKDTPIIAITSLDQDKDVKAALDAGANDYILKPYETVDLTKRIKALLK